MTYTCIVCHKKSPQFFACSNSRNSCWSTLSKEIKNYLGQLHNEIPNHIPRQQWLKYIKEKLK